MNPKKARKFHSPVAAQDVELVSQAQHKEREEAVAEQPLQIQCVIIRELKKHLLAPIA